MTIINLFRIRTRSTKYVPENRMTSLAHFVALEFI